MNPIVHIANLRELETALHYCNDEGPFIDLRGLALIWDCDGVTIYEIPFEIWHSAESPVRVTWSKCWA